MFGGGSPSGTLLGDTWKFVHGQWTNITHSHAPPARRAAGMAYDRADGYVVLFGGLGISDLNDTWTFHHGSWTKVLTTRAPSTRVAPGLTYDAAAKKVLLFGGRNDNLGIACNDTWFFHAGNWTLVPTSFVPPPRFFPAIAYDSVDRVVVMFGGGNFNGSGYPFTSLGDTHTFAARNWT